MRREEKRSEQRENIRKEEKKNFKLVSKINIIIFRALLLSFHSNRKQQILINEMRDRTRFLLLYFIHLKYLCEK